jgi:hypothetical protein
VHIATSRFQYVFALAAAGFGNLCFIALLGFELKNMSYFFKTQTKWSGHVFIEVRSLLQTRQNWKKS